MFISNFVNNALLILLSVLTANKPKMVYLIDTLLTLGTHHALTVPDKVTYCTQHSRTFRHNLSKNCENVFESIHYYSGLFLPIHVCTLIFSTDKTDKQIRL